MAKQLNIDMRFNADTSKAKQAINELEQSLAKLAHGSTASKGIDPIQFEKASAAARELEFHLKNAFNVKTGNIDLSKLQRSLAQSNTSLSQITSSFSSAGNVGKQAFISLARAVATADQPSLTLNTHLSTMLTTLKNVARFQISSSIMHGLIGGIQSALSYAKDLDQSLNNIRIVTGQNIDQMAKFADQANKAARALNATTLDYTNASLIYYQQGLSNEEVVARTETTLKLANVSRQSAEEVSSQMTAIWNNFAEGSENLEYYADVITALGAATASSSEEIAGGLSKFASVAKTVGLSYEYAASALATIVAQTRQSEDTVGTGLRTLLARFEGLKLGDTLEDGVDLNKYSKALKAIGVNVLDANGNLRQMDEILDDMGSKWDTLNQSQKVALAQTVGGVRQYTNLIALMDNWDKFQENLGVANTSVGTLDQQADIYAESWEAARDRVKASAEAVYGALIDEQFFIKVDNIIENVLNGVALFIKNFGGVKNIIITVLSFTASMLASKIGPAVQKIIQDMQILTGGANKVYTKVQQDFKSTVAAETSKKNDDGTNVYSTAQKAELEGISQLQSAKTKLALINDKLSASEKMRAELEISGMEQQINHIKELGEAVTQAEQKQVEALKERQAIQKEIDDADKEKNIAGGYLKNSINSQMSMDTTKAEGALAGTGQDFSSLIQKINEAGGATEQLRQKIGEALLSGGEEAVVLGGKFSQLFKGIATGVNEVNLQEKQNELKYLEVTFEDLFKNTADGGKEFKEVFKTAFSVKEPKDFQKAVSKLGQMITKAEIPANKLGQALKKLGANPKAVDRYTAALQKFKEAEAKAKDATTKGEAADKEAAEAKRELEKAQEQLNKTTANFKPQHTTTLGEGLMKGVAACGQLVSAFNAVKSAVTTLGDSSATFGEKFTASLMAISIGVPAAVGMINNIKAAYDGIAGAVQAYQTAQTALIAIRQIDSALSAKEKGDKVADILLTSGLVKAKDEESAAIFRKTFAEQFEIAMKDKNRAAGLKGIIQSAKIALSKTLEALGHGTNTAAVTAETGAVTALNFAMLPLWAIILLIIAALASLAIAVFLAVKGIQALTNWYNADAIAAQNAEEAAENLAKAYNETKQAYEQLKQSISDYKSARDAIADMTKGTQEWKDAIRDANDQALELINTYGLIEGKDYTIDENGLIQIDNDRLAQLQEEESKKVDQARNASLVADSRAREARATADLTQLKRDNRQSLWEAGAIGGGSGALMGASIGALGGPVGAAIGAGIGGLLGIGSALWGAISGNNESDAKIDSAVERLTTGDLAARFKNNELSDQQLMDELGIDDEDLIAAIKELAKTMNDNTAMQKKQYEEAARTALADQEVVQDSEYADEITRAAGVAYGQIEQDAYDKYFDKASDRTFFNAGTDEAKEVFADYAKVTGLDQKKGFEVTNYRGDGKIEYKYIDENNQEQTAIATAEEVAQVLATRDAMAAMEDQAGDIVATFENIASSGDNVSEGLGRMILGFAGGEGGSFAEASSEQMEDFSNLGTLDEEGHLTLDPEKAADILDDWEDLGYESQAAYQEALERAYNDYADREAQLMEALPEKAQQAYNNVDLSKATLAQKEKISKAMGEIYQELGEEGAEALTEVLNKAISEGVDPTVITDTLKKVDWSAPDAMGQLTEMFKEQGIEIDLNDPKWQLLIYRMQEAERTAASLAGRFETLRNGLKEIGDATKDIKFGSIISDEDYQTLLKYNSAIAGLFTMTAGGWQFVGDTEKLNQLLGGTENDIDEIKDKFERANKAGAVLANEDTGTDFDNGRRLLMDFTTGRWIDGDFEGKKVSDHARANAINLMRTNTEAYGETYDTILAEARIDKGAANEALAAFEEASQQEGFNYEQWAEDNAEYAEIITKLWDTAGDLQQSYIDGTYDSLRAEELYVNACVNSVTELNGLLEQGKISADTYSKLLESVAKKEAEGLGLDWDTVQTQAQLTMMAAMNGELEGYQEGIGMSEAAAYQLAIRNAQVDRGLQSMTQNLSKWTNVLKNGSKTSTEYAETINEISTAVADLIGFSSKDMIPVSFYELPEALELIEKAADGSKEAIQALGIAVARQKFKELKPASVKEDGTADLSGAAELYDKLYMDEHGDPLFGWTDAVHRALENNDFETLQNNVINGLDAIQNAADGMTLEEAFGSESMAEEWLASLNAMALATGMSVDEMNSYLNSMGVQADVTTTHIPVQTSIPIYETREKITSPPGAEETVKETSTRIIRHETMTEDMEVAQINMGDSAGTTPTVRRGGGGGASRTSSGGGGGGGGGGSNKSKEKKNPTDEKDRYHTITQKIQDATDAYDKLSKAQDRAFGKERIKAMEGITGNLRLQIELQKKYLDEIRNYLEGDRAAVEELGATFDANGVITNYDDLIAQLVEKYNEGVDAFNNGGLDEDAFKEQYEEPFNDAKEAIDQYVETINLLQSEELNLIDKQNELVDQLREIAAFKLQLHIDFDEDELKYLDFLLEMLGEDAEVAADRLIILGDKFNLSKNEIMAYTTAIQELLKLRGFSDSDVSAFIRGELTAEDLESRNFTSDDIDKLREYRDAIQESTQAMKELAEEIEQSFLDTLDELNDEIDNAEEKFDHFAKMFEHFQNVVDIVGQDALGMSAETMKLIAKNAKANAIEMVKAAKTQLDNLSNVRNQAQAQLDAALNAYKYATTAEERLRAKEMVDYWSQTVEETEDRVRQAQEDLADALENALEGIKDMFTTMIDQTTKEFEHSVTGAANSLEQLQNNFDRQKETQELYIPTYEKIYELTKLTRDINNSIDDTDNLWSKRELAKLQDEINGKMADGVELTEHDVEELRKRYELKLAEAALEEAQSAKRTVRMSRDNEGNWSYVYTADENDVATAEQNYEDKLYEYQQMNYEYIQELQGNIIQAEQDMTDQIKDLDITKFASKEAYLAEVQRIIDATLAKEQQYKDQLAQTLEQQNILYEDDWARYNERTGYRMARDDQWVDNWNETILAQETGFDTLDDMFDQLTGAIGGPDEPGTYIGDITDAYTEMQASNERALNAAGTSMKTYEQDTVDSIAVINEQIDETQSQIEEFSENMTTMMESVTDFISNWKNEYGAAIAELTKFNDNLYTSCQKLIGMLTQTFAVNADFEAALTENADAFMTDEDEAIIKANQEAAKNATLGNKEDVEANKDKYTYTRKGYRDNGDGTHTYVQYYKGEGWTGESYYPLDTPKTHTWTKSGSCSKNCGAYNRNYDQRGKFQEEPDNGGGSTNGDASPARNYTNGDLTPLVKPGAGGGGPQFQDIDEPIAVTPEPTPTPEPEPEHTPVITTGHDVITLKDSYEHINGTTTHRYKQKDLLYDIIYEDGVEKRRTYVKTCVNDRVEQCQINSTGYDAPPYTRETGQCPLCRYKYMRSVSKPPGSNSYIGTTAWEGIGFKTGGYTGTWNAISGRTGMYTGSWNGADVEANGRLAFLHQKELVLNADDTKNFLSAVDMVRQISQTIDLQAASRSNWNFLLPGILGKEPDTLDQNVHIEAHFPNVTSHSEIEEAFTNLVGKASQFANR